MQDILTNKLYEYIRQNNPDVLIPLEENDSVTKYIKDKVDSIKDLLEQLQKENTPAYIIAEVCMEALTKDLRPSKYNYIINILEQDFETVYPQYKKWENFAIEALILMLFSNPVFIS